MSLKTMMVKVVNLRGKLRSVLTSRQTVVAVVLSLCLILAVSSRPFSLFFSLLHNRDALYKVANDLNSRRTQEALDFFNLTPRRTQQELEAMSRPDSASYRFVVAIITVSRQKPANSPRDVGYVLQSAAAVLSQVKGKSAFRDSFVFVCNVDQSPDHHADAVILRDFLPYVERYGGSTVPNVSNLQIPGTEELYRNARHSRTYSGELRDYMFCLQAAQRFNSQYYLILQDDAVPNRDFGDVLEHSLAKLTKPQTCLHRSSSVFRFLQPSNVSCLLEHPPYTSHLVPEGKRRVSPSPASSFGYIKFYFPERWHGFAFETLRILDLCSFAVIGGGLGVVFQAVCAYRRQKIYVPALRAFVLGVVISVCISYIVGRQNLNELRRVSKYLYRFQSSPRCCVPAMLYPAPVMPFLVTWLAESPAGSLVDLRIADCFQHYDMPSYYIEPNIVHHIGMLSTLPKKDEKPVEEFLLFQ